MKVGLLSDSHDRVPAIAALLREFQKREVTFVLHAGDFCAPFSLKPFQDLGIAMAGVFGRNDGDREGLRAFAGRGVGSELYESPHSVELDGRRILLVHELGEVNPRSVEAHEFVIHGCTHRTEVAERGSALLVNPGEACGWLHGVPTGAILDLATRQVELLRLEGPEWRS